jgi:hypothetical protein
MMGNNRPLCKDCGKDYCICQLPPNPNYCPTCAERERYRDANESLDKAAKEQLARAERAESALCHVREAAGAVVAEWYTGDKQYDTDALEKLHSVLKETSPSPCRHEERIKELEEAVVNLAVRVKTISPSKYEQKEMDEIILYTKRKAGMVTSPDDTPRPAPSEDEKP